MKRRENINYREARKQYFEDYVEFENLVFTILHLYMLISLKYFTNATSVNSISNYLNFLPERAKELLMNSKHSEDYSLSAAIKDLEKIMNVKINNQTTSSWYNYGLNKSELLKFKSYRNDLAHKNGDFNVAKGIVKDLENIENLNKELISLLLSINIK